MINNNNKLANSYRSENMAAPYFENMKSRQPKGAGAHIAVYGDSDHLYEILGIS